MGKNKKIIIAVSIIAILLLIIALFLLFANKIYNVTFDSKGGTEVVSQTVKKNGLATEPKDPTREGYNFLGWYTSEESNEKYDFAAKVNKDLTLIAKWEEKEITKVSIITEKKEINVNDEFSLTVKVMAEDEELNVEKLEVIWSSSDETIATVDKSGKVKTLKAGTVTITATVNGKKAELKLTVKSEEKTVQTSTQPISNNNNTNTKPSNSTGNTTKPTTKPTTKVTYTYKWEKIDSSVAGQYMLYIVSSEGKKVAGTATITTIGGKQSTVSIPESGVIYVKDAVSSVSNVKVAN